MAHQTTDRLRLLGWLSLSFILCSGCAAGIGSGAENKGGTQASVAQPSAAVSNTMAPPSSMPAGGGTTAAAPGPEAPNVVPSPNTTAAPTLPAQPVSPASPNALLCDGTVGRRVAVSTAAALSAALAAAQPMDVITLAPGTYEGTFVAKAVGTAQMPIALCGSANAILRGPSLTTGYTLYLQDAQYWQVVGLTVTGGAKGIMLDRASFNLIKNVTVTAIGSEGIHLRVHSQDNVVDGCTVSKTGTAGNPKFGEGIYIGSSMNNWCTLTAGQADRSDRNTIQNCTVSESTSEAIDIKEGSSNGSIIGNTLDGAGIDLVNATSLVNVKGNSYLLQGNKMQHAPEDAFSVHVLMPGWGACNRFVGNVGINALSGYGVHLAAGKPWPAIEVTSDNQFESAAAGVTNAVVDGPKPTDACVSSSVSVTCPGG